MKEILVDPGSLAWVLTSAALVLFMTPGLALFYGGMDRSRSVLNMLMMNFWCVLAVPVLWVAIGYTLALNPFENDWIGNFDAAFLGGIGILDDGGGAIATVAFMGMFAVITPALISGAVASRMKFSAWALFVPLWLILVLAPVFKAVFGGYFAQRGALDFAGGTAIHVNAGIAALAVALVLGRRAGWPRENSVPHSMPLVMLGTGILWFGWFGFNAGSALGATGQTAQAFINTFVAAAAGGLTWALVERMRDGHFTNLGAASGIVAGLVAVTPAAGFVSGAAPIAIGALAGVASCYAVKAKYRFGYDDSLDVVGVHFVAGLVGSMTVGLFANPSFFGLDFGEGLLYGGGFSLLREQLFANTAVAAYSFGATLLIAIALKRTIGIRVSEEVETAGIDRHLHNESAYDFGAIVGWITTNGDSRTAARTESELEFAEGERELDEFEREVV
jgi:Amt family ammonium transporter